MSKRSSRSGIRWLLCSNVNQANSCVKENAGMGALKVFLKGMIPLPATLDVIVDAILENEESSAIKADEMTMNTSW